MRDSRVLYISGPLFAGSIHFTKTEKGWQVEAVPYAKELIKGLRMRELEEGLKAKGYSVWWVGENDDRN